MGVLVVTADTSYHRTNYDAPFREICDDVEVFHYADGMSAPFWGSSGRALAERRNHELLDVAMRMKADGRLNLVFASAYDDFLRVSTLRRLRSLGAVIVVHMVDMPTQWYRLLKTGPYFDVIAIAHRDFEERLARRAQRIDYVPMAANPNVYRPVAVPGAGPAVSFVGSWSPVRATVLGAVREAFPMLGVYGNWRRASGRPKPVRNRIADLASYGPARLRAEAPGLLRRTIWRRSRRHANPAPDSQFSNGVLDIDDMVRLFSGSLINIGISQSEGPIGATWPRKWVRGRDFEVPMSGGFYLVQAAPEQENHFVPGTEIETWSTVQELVEKVEHFLEHPDSAMKTARRARARALRDHTWHRRLGSFVASLGLERELRNAPPNLVEPS